MKLDKPRPSWALAFIKQKWRYERTVSKAYKLASADDVITDLARRPSDEVLAAVRAARDECAGYVRVLDSVLADWDAA